MVQKRLLSSKPAEANTSFWVFESWADPGITDDRQDRCQRHHEPKGSEPLQREP